MTVNKLALSIQQFYIKGCNENLFGRVSIDFQKWLKKQIFETIQISFTIKDENLNICILRLTYVQSS